MLQGVTGAKAGTLSFLVGGTEESFEIAKPILAHMGQRIIHCGPSGAGLGAKICNNVRCYATQFRTIHLNLLDRHSLGRH